VRVDVIVVGLGSMGSSAAYRLAARGFSVLGLDRFDPPHGRGAHSGGSRIIRMAYMEGPQYVPLVRRSMELWRRLEADAGESVLTNTGGLMLGRPESIAFGGALATARTQELPHEVLDANEVRRRFPAFTPAEHELGLFEEIAGLLRPEQAISAQLSLARSHGAQLRTGVVVEDWAASPAGVILTTTAGTFEADRLVLAPGAWAPGLVRLRQPLRVQRRVQHYWRPRDPAPFEPGRLPVWIWDWGSGQAGYGLPAVDGAVKAALHYGNDPVDPDVGAEPARSDEIAAMRQFMASRLPALAEGQWLGSTPCHYTMTDDEHFVLGIHPDHPNVFVACGFSGHGFKFTPIVGEILADLASDGSTAADIAIFDPGRTTTGAGP
jgi:sarcosine oxidase